ncbi:MAG: zinc dependent phospholipase C family protein [Erysipelotrichaceae bacterium]|nr:zinc dependent phospholipase C family protein [Erysipelotrichaceae bacterium]
MPNIIAHCMCGEKALALTDTELVRNSIQEYHGVFMLGCQGPDPFYLYHRLPWQSKKDFDEVLHYGDVLHKEHINDNFRMMLEESKESMHHLDIAYVMGFMCHWALDHTAHPYIFYETDSLTEDIGSGHQLFETMIDKGVLMINNMNVTEFQTYKLLQHPEETDTRVWNLLRPIFKKLDNLDLTYRQVKDSIADFHNIQKLFYDPKGKKNKWVRILEDALHQHGMATGMMVPKEYDYEMDAMNFRKRAWVHPCDETLRSADSFREMLEQAVNDTVKLMKLYEGYLKDSVEVEEILDFIGNRTFDTGMQPGVEMKYFRKDMEK